METGTNGALGVNAVWLVTRGYNVELEYVMIQARSMVEITVLGLIETHKPARWEGAMKVCVSQCILCILLLYLVWLLAFITITKKLQHKGGVFSTLNKVYISYFF